MLGDITAPQPGSKKVSEANVCEEKPEALGLPNKGALCRRGHGYGHHHRRTEQSWPGFPQSLSLVLYNLIMFPFRGLSRSSSSECQAASVRHGLVVDCSGRRGALGLLGKQSSQGLSWGARSGLQAERNSPAWERVGAAIARRWGSSCAPGSNSRHPAIHPHPAWHPALGEAERKSRLFCMPRAGSATAISFMCHRWL